MLEVNQPPAETRNGHANGKENGKERAPQPRRWR